MEAPLTSFPGFVGQWHGWTVVEKKIIIAMIFS